MIVGTVSRSPSGANILINAKVPITRPTPTFTIMGVPLLGLGGSVGSGSGHGSVGD